MTTGASATDPVVYGAVNAFVVAQGQTVQIVLNNLDAAIHPFHLHGNSAYPNPQSLILMP